MTGGARLLGRHRRAWLTAGAAGIAAIGAALTPFPAAVPDAGVRSAFAALASAAIVTLAILPFIVWRSAARPNIWVTAAAVSLVLGVAAFATAGYVQRPCVAPYAGTSVIIGTELTELGTKYTQDNPDISIEQLLEDAPGVRQALWTPASVGRCSALITGTYFLWIPFLVVCLLATAQAVPTSLLAPVRWDAPAPAPAAALPIRYDVFVSYRHEGADRVFARNLVAALEAEGYTVAIDERDFRANASFLQEMERAVRQSRFTVAVISRRYLESGNTEEEVMISRVLDLGDRKRRLIPLLIEPVAMPVWLYGIVGIDWTKRDPLVDPFDKLKATLGAPGTKLAGVDL